LSYTRITPGSEPETVSPAFAISFGAAFPSSKPMAWVMEMVGDAGLEPAKA
jgi:hypothetical protein